MNDAAAPASQNLYVRREKIHAREVRGRFNHLREVSVVVLLGLYYGVAWLPWEGRQAVLFDLPARQFYIFGMTLWPQDFVYLAWLLIMAALTLFFVTALAGRVFCGYACPQTVWTQAFVWIERWVEGNRSKRLKLEKAPWNAEKIRKKVTKHALWILLAFWTGFTFVGYFTPIRELAMKVISFQTGGWETFWIFFYGFATWGNGGMMREQVCKYMCPYARFQSAMFDKDTLIVSYDAGRGEPRGSRKKNVDRMAAGLGDCVDCQVCVQVCPTGIDIRKGLQYECIACALCVDACDSIMDKMNYPRGLIRYSTEHAMHGESTRVLRLRTVIYGTLLATLFGLFVFSLLTRDMLRLDVIRDRNALYRQVSTTQIENVYTLKVHNKDNQSHAVRITVEGDLDLQVETEPSNPVLAPGELASLAARVRADRAALSAGMHEMVFSVESTDEPQLEFQRKTRFYMPPAD